MIIHKLTKPGVCVIYSVVRSFRNPSAFSIFRISRLQASYRRFTYDSCHCFGRNRSRHILHDNRIRTDSVKKHATNIVTLQAQVRERRYFHNQLIENCACARSGQLSKTMPLGDKSLYISGSEVSLSFGFGSRQEECVCCTSFYCNLHCRSIQNRQAVLLRIQEFPDFIKTTKKSGGLGFPGPLFRSVVRELRVVCSTQAITLRHFLLARL